MEEFSIRRYMDDELLGYVKRSIVDISRKCNLKIEVVQLKFLKVMEEKLEQLLIDMRDSADYTGNNDLHYYAEQLEKIIRKNF